MGESSCDVESRVRNASLRSRIMSPQEAAKIVKDGMCVGCSGFTPSGYPKAVPLAIAERVRKAESEGGHEPHLLDECFSKHLRERQSLFLCDLSGFGVFKSKGFSVSERL